MANMVASLIHTVSTHTSEVTCVTFSHDKLATCSGDKTTRLWSVDDFSELPGSPLLGHKYYVNYCAFSSFGTLLATCSTDGRAILWDVKTGEQVAVLQHTSKAGIRIGRFSPDSTKFVTGSDDDTMCLWDVPTKQLIKTYTGHDESVVTVAFSPDSALLVSGSPIGHLFVWDAKYGHGCALVFEPDGHDLGVTCSDFSPTYGTAETPHSPVGQFLLATGGKDNQIKLWILTAKAGSADVLLKMKDTLPGHADSVLTCCFSPNGLTLASGSLDKTVRMWDPIAGVALYSIEGHTRYVTSVAFSTDGKLLATGSNDKTIMVWQLTDTTSIMANLSGYEEPEKPPQESPVVSGVSQSLTALSNWTEADVCQWLKDIGLPQYCDAFMEHAIDGTELLNLTQEDLQNSLGIAPLGHRNKILRLRGRVERAEGVIPAKVNDANVPDEYLCPITREIMKDPVICTDGYTYDRAAITSWMQQGKDCSPMTNAPLGDRTLTPNRTLKMLIQRYCQSQP